MAIKEIVAAIEARLTALGFTATEDVFDFYAVPASIANLAYRIEAKRIGCAYWMNHHANPQDAIEIYIAYAMTRKARTAWKTALDDRERIEKDLLSAASILALASNPLLMMDADATAAKERDGWLVSRLVFNCDYLRDLTP
jgi:hypothetical protein